MKNILLHPNEGRDLNLAVSTRISAFLQEKGINTCVPEGKCLKGASTLSQDHLGDADLCIVFGGDGSMIRAAHLLEGTGVPLVGVNLGSVGYMTEIDAEHAEEAITAILDGRARVENRLMLDGRIVFEDGTEESFTAMNDLVLRRSDYSGAIRFAVEINGKHFDNMRGDGLIIACPNGATGYNLSAGGPLISPTADNLILTPLCNHSLLERSLVLSGSDKVTLVVDRSDYQDAPLFSCDSYRHCRLDRSCRIEVTRSDKVFPLVRIGNENDFGQLTKLLSN